MKLRAMVIAFFLGVSVISGCGQGAADWAHRFVVWNRDLYIVTSETVSNVGKEIGHVTKYSDKEGTYFGNFSNTFPVGTKYYEIQGVDPKTSIAVKTQDGKYVKADNQGKYGAR